jgi:hypothetical protein
MKYNINNFDKFLEVYKQIDNLKPSECIEILHQGLFLNTFSYFLPGKSTYLINKEIANLPQANILFLGTGNGIWLRDLELNNRFSIIPETAELGTFIKHIFPDYLIVEDDEERKYDFIIIANSDLEIPNNLIRKLTKGGKIIAIKDHDFLVKKDFSDTRLNLKNYLSLTDVYNVGYSTQMLGLYFVSPYVNVNKVNKDYYLLKFSTEDTNYVHFYSTSSWDFDSYVINQIEKTSIDSEEFYKYSMSYSDLGDRWDFLYNTPLCLEIRKKVLLRGGQKLETLCKNIMIGIRFYSNNRRFNFKYYKSYQIINSSDFSTEKEDTSQRHEKFKSSRQGLLSFRIPKNADDVETHETWKIAKCIAREGDLLINRTYPFTAFIIENKKFNNHIISHEFIIIRSDYVFALIQFFKSQSFLDQIQGVRRESHLDIQDLLNLIVPTSL